jgi:hypothetical protein
LFTCAKRANTKKREKEKGETAGKEPARAKQVLSATKTKKQKAESTQQGLLESNQRGKQARPTPAGIPTGVKSYLALIF